MVKKYMHLVLVIRINLFLNFYEELIFENYTTPIYYLNII